MTTISAELAVYGDDLDPDHVTSVFNIEPTKTWVRGDIRNRRTNQIYEYGCWKICTEANDSSLEEHVQRLMQRVAGSISLIPLFASERGYEIELSVIVKMAGESPDISLSRGAMQWICKLDANLDLDIYQ